MIRRHVKNSDGKYWQEFTTDAKSSDSEAGGWPADLPKPSVGGYGYTEQGEQTVITWDGDTEGRTVVEVAGAFSIVLVSDKTPSSIIGGTIEFSSGGLIDIDSEHIVSSGEWGYMVADGTAFVIFEDDTTVDGLGVTFEHKGVYFQSPLSTGASYITALTYGTPDTVHKIDEKYLPDGGGGVMVVNFTAGAGGFTSDKTPQEIVSAFNGGTFVYGVLMGTQTATLTLASGGGDGNFNIQFNSIAFIPNLGLSVTLLVWDNDDSTWEYFHSSFPLN